MKKRLITLLALCAAAAWAADLNPPGSNVCGAGSINSDPSTIYGEPQFAKIYENLTAKISSDEVWKICTNDGTWWSSGSLPNRTYAYMHGKVP